MKKILMGACLSVSVLMLALIGALPVLTASPGPVTAVTQPVSISCGAQQDTPVDTNTFQSSFDQHTVRARVYWKRCWDGNGNKWVNPIAVRGGYEVTGGECRNNLRLDGYRFNFGTIGGYNVPTFFVPDQSDCGNHQTVNIESESHYIPAYTLGACWGVHETQVWNYANDIEKDGSGCMNY